MHAGPGRFTLVMVLPPHEDAAPVRQVVRYNGQPVPPGLHHRLHVMEAVVPTQVSGLQACIYLCSFLELDDLLGSLRRAPESPQLRARVSTQWERRLLPHLTTQV